jgi:hypothetical protein
MARIDTGVLHVEFRHVHQRVYDVSDSYNLHDLPGLMFAVRPLPMRTTLSTCAKE